MLLLVCCGGSSGALQSSPRTFGDSGEDSESPPVFRPDRSTRAAGPAPACGSVCPDPAPPPPRAGIPCPPSRTQGDPPANRRAEPRGPVAACSPTAFSRTRTPPGPRDAAGPGGAGLGPDTSRPMAQLAAGAGTTEKNCGRPRPGASCRWSRRSRRTRPRRAETPAALACRGSNARPKTVQGE